MLTSTTTVAQVIPVLDVWSKEAAVTASIADASATVCLHSVALSRLLAPGVRPTAWETVAAAVPALLAVLTPLWRWTRLAVTVAHEGAHALVAVCVGRHLTGIRLHSDTSGETLTLGTRSRVPLALVAVAGYAGPALLGLVAAAALSRGYVTAVLWGAFVLLAAMLVYARNLTAVLVIVVLGGALAATSALTGTGVQILAATAATWFLLMAAPRPVVELHRQRRRVRTPGSDADTLARLTLVPAPVWLLVWLAADVWALGTAGRWLLH